MSPAYIVVAIVWAFSSGAFFGFVRAAQISKHIERRYQVRLGTIPPPGEALVWSAKHPTLALLVDLWLFSSAIGVLYCTGVVILVLIKL